MTLAPSLNSGQTSAIEGFSFVGSRDLGRKLRSFYWKKQKVQVRRLDDIWGLYNLDRIKLIKIDIEGYEFFALKSANQILREKKIDNILVEFHPEQLHSLQQSPEQIVDFLASFGYVKSEQYEDLFCAS